MWSFLKSITQLKQIFILLIFVFSGTFCSLHQALSKGPDEPGRPEIFAGIMDQYILLFDGIPNVKIDYMPHKGAEIISEASLQNAPRSVLILSGLGKAEAPLTTIGFNMEYNSDQLDFINEIGLFEEEIYIEYLKLRSGKSLYQWLSAPSQITFDNTEATEVIQNANLFSDFIRFFHRRPQIGRNKLAAYTPEQIYFMEIWGFGSENFLYRQYYKYKDNPDFAAALAEEARVILIKKSTMKKRRMELGRLIVEFTVIFKRRPTAGYVHKYSQKELNFFLRWNDTSEKAIHIAYEKFRNNSDFQSVLTQQAIAVLESKISRSKIWGKVKKTEFVNRRRETKKWNREHPENKRTNNGKESIALQTLRAMIPTIIKLQAIRQQEKKKVDWGRNQKYILELRFKVASMELSILDHVTIVLAEKVIEEKQALIALWKTLPATDGTYQKIHALLDTDSTGKQDRDEKINRLCQKHIKD